MAKHAPVRLAPGGVGAVRRAAHSLGGARPKIVFLVAMLFAVGVGSPQGFRPPSQTEMLAARRIEATPPVHQREALAQALARLREAADPSVPVEPVPPPVEAPPMVPVTVQAPVERAIVAPPSFSARPAKPARPVRSPAGAHGPKEGGVWAVSVGIDDYPGHDGDLRAAAADARDVDAALAAYGVPGHRRVLLLDHNATALNIRNALVWLAGRASPDATVVFFYSGHVRQVSNDPDRDGEAVDEAIVGADGDHVFDGDVAEIFRTLEARSAWIGIAACYGGGFDDALAPGRLITAAAAEPDVAYENSELGHSYLVEYMVRRAMLQGKAAGSVQDAFAWAQSQIAKDYPNRQPVIADRSRGPLVLGAHGSAGPAPAAEPTTAPETEPAPRPAEPANPPNDPPADGSPSCAQVLGVTVCSAEDTSARSYGRRPAV